MKKQGVVVVAEGEDKRKGSGVVFRIGYLQQNTEPRCSCNHRDCHPIYRDDLCIEINSVWDQVGRFHPS
jgi:hypothetical protein